MSYCLGKGLSLLLLRNLGLLLLLFNKDLVHMAVLSWLVLDSEHGRPVPAVTVLVTVVAARLKIVFFIVLNLE